MEIGLTTHPRHPHHNHNQQPCQKQNVTQRNPPGFVARQESGQTIKHAPLSLITVFDQGVGRLVGRAGPGPAFFDHHSISS